MHKGGSHAPPSSRGALRFVILVGILSFFADFTYEGARSVLGPYLASFGISATIIGIVIGFGELAGYGLRLASGRLADATGMYRPIMIGGYVVQMAAVPALALTGNWQGAAVLIVLERTGKAIRNPPRDAMLSHAAKRVGGYGWAFGLHEALDQFGAMVGPLVVAGMLAHRESYHLAFAVLAIPALINLGLVSIARYLYPRPQDLEVPALPTQQTALPRRFWLYLAAAALIAAGFADYPIIAYHFSKTGSVGRDWIPVFYAVAMAVSGSGSIIFGRLYDHFGFASIIALTLISVLFAPLVFLGGFWIALVGAALWGLGMGVHEAVIPAAVAPMVSAERRAYAFGLFTAGYGISWFVGSALIGILYDASLAAVISFCVLAQLAAVPILVFVRREGLAANGSVTLA